MLPTGYRLHSNQGGRRDYFKGTSRKAMECDWITRQVIFADGGASLMNPEVPPEIQLS
jgi:hypothetical protein